MLNSFSSLLPSFKPQPTSAKSSQPQIAQGQGQGQSQGQGQTQGQGQGQGQGQDKGRGHLPSKSDDALLSEDVQGVWVHALLVDHDKALVCAVTDLTR